MIFRSKVYLNSVGKVKIHDFPGRLYTGILMMLFFFNINSLTSQDLLGASSRFDNDLTEWVIYFLDGNVEREGRLHVQDPMDIVHDRWIFSFAGIEGTIKQNMRGDHNQWILTSGNERINIRTIWSDNFCDWRISNRIVSVDFSCVYAGDLQNWEMRNNRMGELEIFATTLNDPRDWGIRYDVIPEISPLIQLAMLFAAITTSI